MHLHADSLELRRLRYDLIYTYKVFFGLVNGSGKDLFTLTSVFHRTGMRGLLILTNYFLTVIVLTCTSISFDSVF